MSLLDSVCAASPEPSSTVAAVPSSTASPVATPVANSNKQQQVANPKAQGTTFAATQSASAETQATPVGNPKGSQSTIASASTSVSSHISFVFSLFLRLSDTSLLGFKLKKGRLLERRFRQPVRHCRVLQLGRGPGTCSYFLHACLRRTRTRILHFRPRTRALVVNRRGNFRRIHSGYCCIGQRYFRFIGFGRQHHRVGLYFRFQPHLVRLPLCSPIFLSNH